MSWTFVAEDSLLLLLSSLQLLRVDRVIGFWLNIISDWKIVVTTVALK